MIIFYRQTANLFLHFLRNGNSIDKKLYSYKKSNLIKGPWNGLGIISIFPGIDTLVNFKSLYIRPMDLWAKYLKD